MEHVLDVKNLTTVLHTKEGDLKPLEDISFYVERGETVGLVGESGCGKSMTINSLMRLLPEKSADISADEICVDGENVTGLTEKEFCRIRGRKMAMIFQEPMTSLNPSLKIGYQIAESLRIHTKCGKKEAAQRVREILQAVGITDADRVASSYAHNLSGGMRQRVVIAMAIICHPDILLADEPTTALDVTIQDQILHLIKDVQKQFWIGVVLVTHDLGVVAEQCDRIIIMYCGQIVEEADTVSVFTRTMHPYTQGLLECIPKLTDDRPRLPHIEGSVMPIQRFGEAGCRFAVRCRYAEERCRRETPPLIEVERGHTCRCWKYGNAGESREGQDGEKCSDECGAYHEGL